jgi:polyisoprenyl-phosphate glycosyltransferase
LKITAIIPAFNEEDNIGSVLKTMVSPNLVDEIIVVSDGSEDQTVQVASAFEGVRVLELLENRGKGGAVKAGLDNCTNEIILILDADLTGLTTKHIQSLLDPIVSGKALMATGIFEKGRMVTDFAQKVAPFLSGQRALKREILESISDLDLTRFGIEVALHQYAEEQGLENVVVQLPDLSHVMKEEKLGFWKGLLSRAQMYWEIVLYAFKAERNQR